MRSVEAAIGGSVMVVLRCKTSTPSTKAASDEGANMGSGADERTGEYVSATWCQVLSQALIARALPGADAMPATTSAAVFGETMPCTSLSAPHSSTPANVAGASHRTHAHVLHDESPVGIVGGAPKPGTDR